MKLYERYRAEIRKQESDDAARDISQENLRLVGQSTSLSDLLLEDALKRS